MPPRRRTPFERRLEHDQERSPHDRAFQGARSEIDAFDRNVRAVLEEIDAARERKRLSKAALAARVDIPPETIRRLLTAERPNPTLATLMKLARALGLRIALVRDGPRR